MTGRLRETDGVGGRGCQGLGRAPTIASDRCHATGGLTRADNGRGIGLALNDGRQ